MTYRRPERDDFAALAILAALQSDPSGRTVHTGTNPLTPALNGTFDIKRAAQAADKAFRQWDEAYAAEKKALQAAAVAADAADEAATAARDAAAIAVSTEAVAVNTAVDAMVAAATTGERKLGMVPELSAPYGVTSGETDAAGLV